MEVDLPRSVAWVVLDPAMSSALQTDLLAPLQSAIFKLKRFSHLQPSFCACGCDSRLPTPHHSSPFKHPELHKKKALNASSRSSAAE